MSLRRNAALGALLAVAFALLHQVDLGAGQVAPLITEDCLGCLCQASTNCNFTMDCIQGDKYLCGPFLISVPYWTDGGRFVLANDSPTRAGAFEACVKDPVCAGETVRGYMATYAQDCNQDGVIDCKDFARLHVLGGFGCTAPGFESTAFFQQYQRCRQTIERLSG